MRIVDRKTFLAMPAETLFSKYEPCVMEHLQIKGDSIGEPGKEIDFFYQQIVDAIDAKDSGEWGNKLEDARNKGISIGMDFDTQGRDGCFTEDQLFAVWEPEDVRHLINRLQRVLATISPLAKAEKYPLRP